MQWRENSVKIIDRFLFWNTRNIWSYNFHRNRPSEEWVLFYAEETADTRIQSQAFFILSPNIPLVWSLCWKVNQFIYGIKKLKMGTQTDSYRKMWDIKFKHRFRWLRPESPFTWNCSSKERLSAESFSKTEPLMQEHFRLLSFALFFHLSHLDSEC